MNDSDNENGTRSLATLLIILALLSGVILLLYSLRRRILEGLHGGHRHGHERLETAGRTIHWAGTYDLVSNILFLGKVTEVQESIVSLAQIKPGDQALDVGCGTGSITLLTARRVGPDGAILGIDASPEMIAVARRKAAEQGLDLSFEVGLVEKLPYEDGRFDLIMNSLVLHHLPGDLKVLAFAEFYRVLKPGGRLFAVDFEPPRDGLARAVYGLFLGNDMMRNDISGLEELLGAAGFENVKTGPTGSRLLSYLSGRKPDTARETARDTARLPD